MRYTFDPNKDALNIAKHGISLSAGPLVFFDARHIIRQSPPSPEWGEERWVAIGTIHGVVYAVVYTNRTDERRLISIRKARRNERQRYDSGNRGV